jgi:lysine 6-dehydrogenase
MEITAAVVGAGRQGLCAAYDLARLPGVGKIVVVDRNEDRLYGVAKRWTELGIRAELVPKWNERGESGFLREALAGTQAVVSAVPFAFGPAVCEAAISVGAHAVDLGGNLAVSQKIHALGPDAAERNCVIAPDCGLMPGLGNTLAGDAIARLEAQGGSNISVEIRCGGLPRIPKNPLGYELVFSFDGLINEYDGASDVIRDGAIANDPTLEDIIAISHPKLGALEAATTSGGTSTAPRSFLGRVHNYAYKTVRYPGHFAFFLMLKRLGFFREDQRSMLKQCIEPKIATGAPDDLVLLRVGAVAENGVSHSSEILDFRDEATGFTAMERMTAFPAVAVLELALEGRLRAGSLRVECDLPMEDYLSRLARRGVLAPERM